MLSLAFAILFLVFVTAAAFAGKLPAIVCVCYLGASIASLLAYVLDKSAAQNGQWRTKERTLHMLALFGGWPGALVAQRLLRHKSKKRSFQRLFWLIVVLNCSALIRLMYRP